MPDAAGGYWLTEPQLRFDYENRKALSNDAYAGLRSLGPYDLAERRKLGEKTIRAVIIGRDDRVDQMQEAKAALQSRRLGKLHEVFELHIVEDVLIPAPARPKDEADAYRRAVQDWLISKRGNPGVQLALVLHDDEELYKLSANGVSPYYASKSALLSAGIPTQNLCYKHLTPARLPAFQAYFVTNILIACYAKLGGKPWVIQDDTVGRPEITLGVATTGVPGSGDQDDERFVGISTIFKENGAFVLWQLTPLHQSLEEYEESLETSIVSAISQYEEMERREVVRIACHVSGKRAGRREIDAIRRALSHFEPRRITADLVHITGDATLWLFDGRDSSHRPAAGFLACLSANGSMALLHTEGRRDRGPPKFPPRPLKIGIHSDIPENGCLDIYQHLYDLRWMSWRGVATATKPVSIDYPQRMARLLAHLYLQEEVEALDLLPKLTTKTWFL